MDQKFNFLRVMTEMKKSEILDEAKRLAAEAGQTKYIGFYQKARSNIQKQLTEDEIEEYKQTVKKWNAGSMPAAVQVK